MRKTGYPLFKNEEEAREACYKFVEKIVGDDEIIIKKNEIKWYEITVKTKRLLWYNYEMLTNDALMTITTENEKLVIQYYFDWQT